MVDLGQKGEHLFTFFILYYFHKLEDLPLAKVIYLHFLCEPLNPVQKLELIRFHIDRHFIQISNIKKN